MFPIIRLYNNSFQLPKLQAKHDEAVHIAYSHHDLDIEELRAAAQQEWEQRGDAVIPDVASMVKADVHGHKTEQRLGCDMVLSTQANTLKMTGESTLAEDSRQYLIMSVSREHSQECTPIASAQHVPGNVLWYFTLSFQALRDMQLLSLLEKRAIRLCQEAISRIILSFAGTDTGGFVKFVVNSFSGTEEFSRVQADAALHIVTGDTDEEEAEEEGLKLFTATFGEGSVDIADVCAVTEAKPAYPVDLGCLSSTGVPREFASENMPSGPTQQSTYFCLFGKCKVIVKQKMLLMMHICRKHLGVTVACKYCGKMWWSERSFCGHMEKLHKELD